MRILLLNTPFYRLMGSHYNGLSLGLLYIASVLKNNNHDVFVLNSDHEDRNDYLNQTEIFNSFNKYKEIHENENHPIWNGVVEEILKYNPEYIGITMFTANHKASKIISKKIKQIDNKIKIVVGGVHPTLTSNEILNTPEFDYAIIGEGEYSMLKLVNGVDFSNIEGLVYRKNNNIIINKNRYIENLNDIPFPARDLIVNSKENTDFGQLITGRGCPFSCTYCASPSLWNRKARLRSVNNVIDELKDIVKNYPFKDIYFEDDTFTMDKNRTLEICDKILENKLNIKWKCDTRADCITDSMVKKMKDSGCIRMKIGVESGSERILKSINKRVNKDTILNATNIIKENGVPLTIYLMTGFPNETDDDLKETINFAKKINADYYSLSIASPYYGTKIYDDFIKNNNINKENWEYFYHQSGEMIMNKNLSKSLINEFLSLNEGKVRV